jgi:DNA-binding FadR family transcriptional regulator
MGRLICCYFAASGIDHQQAFDAFHWLSSETMALAASHADAPSIVSIGDMLTQIEGRADTALLPVLAAIEHRQLALAGNPLLDLFLLSARAFPSWSRFGTMSTAPGALTDLRECAAQVNAAIAAGDASAAALAQSRKSIAIRRNLQRLHCQHPG